jgi:hypothetical protein
VKLLWLLALVACDRNFDARWQLAHDRIIAVRTTPATLAAGDTAVVDAYVTSAAGGPSTASPALLASEQLVIDGSNITAPDDAQLAMLRTAANLAADAPVPLELTTTFVIDNATFVATKTVIVGTHADNPTIGAVTLDGVAPTSPIMVPYDTDVVLLADEDPTILVNWFTSCGSLNDDDNEHTAKLHVNPDDPLTGQFAIVIRDLVGGVAWQDWTMQSATPPSPSRVSGIR